MMKNRGWQNTILASLANYIDAGSIVAGSAALALWVERYHLSATFVGLAARPARMQSPRASVL